MITHDQAKEAKSACLFRADVGYGGVTFSAFGIIKETPKGKRIDVYGTMRTVLNDTRKRFAHETKEAAVAALIARRKRQIEILTSRVEKADEELQIASEWRPDAVYQREPRWCYQAREAYAREAGL